MPSLDNLCAVPEYLTGTIISVKPIATGHVFVIIDDSGVNLLGNRRRWVADTKALTKPADIRKGSLCEFLPGVPTKPGAMPRAHHVTILQKSGPNKPAIAKRA